MSSKPPFVGERVPLGELGKMQGGGTPSSKHPEFFTGAIPWIGTTALNGKLLDESDAVKLISEEAIEKSATKLIPANSIMVGTRVGVGKAAINAVPMCTSQDVVSIIGIDESKWNKEFILLTLRYKAPILAAQAQGATITGVTSKALKSITIPVLAPERQGEIVFQLRGIERQIDAVRQEINRLDSLAKSRFVEMFMTGDFPVESIGQHALDIHYGTSEKADSKGDYIYLRMNNMTDRGTLDLTDTKRISLGEKALKNCLVKKGDLLFNRTNSREKVGKTCVFQLDEPMVIAGYIIRVRLDETVDSNYLAAFMNLSSTKRMLRSIAKGAVHQANINAKQLAAIRLPMPPLSLQREFAAFAAQVDKSESIARKQIEKLQMLYDSLAQEYFG